MVKYCKNHPSKKALSFCKNCGEFYCKECLNEGKEYYYCNLEECFSKFQEEGENLTSVKTSKLSKLAILVLTIIIATIAGTIGKQFAIKLFSKSEKNISIESELQTISNEINKKCPIIIDSNTRLDNTGALGGSLYYNYTFINYTINEIDISYMEADMKPNILNNIRTNPGMRYLRDRKVTFIYSYKDRFGEHVTSFVYQPEDYLR